jgi:hypothetical protein
MADTGGRRESALEYLSPDLPVAGVVGAGMIPYFEEGAKIWSEIIFLSEGSRPELKRPEETDHSTQAPRYDFGVTGCGAFRLSRL